jgi:hypothetical protein
MMTPVSKKMTVSQKTIDALLEAFRLGDHSAADTLWDLQEYMTPEQCAETQVKVHEIIGDD